MNLKDIVIIVEGDKFKFFEEYLRNMECEIRLYPCRINKGEKIIMMQKILDLNFEDASFVGINNTKQLSVEEHMQYMKHVIMK